MADSEDFFSNFFATDYAIPTRNEEVHECQGLERTSEVNEATASVFKDETDFSVLLSPLEEEVVCSGATETVLDSSLCAVANDNNTTPNADVEETAVGGATEADVLLCMASAQTIDGRGSVSPAGSALSVCDGLSSIVPMLRAPREERDSRQRVQEDEIFTRKRIPMEELCKVPDWRKKARNEISRNCVAQRTILGRGTARTHWENFCMQTDRSPDVVTFPPSAEDVVLFAGLLRAMVPQSALTYFSSWKSWVEDERRERSGPALKFEYDKAVPALVSAKGRVHKDAPLTPAWIARLSEVACTDSEIITLKMAIFAFWAILRMDEFANVDARFGVAPARGVRVASLDWEARESFRSDCRKKLKDPALDRTKRCSGAQGRLRPAGPMPKRTGQGASASCNRVESEREVVRASIQRRKNKLCAGPTLRVHALGENRSGSRGVSTSVRSMSWIARTLRLQKTWLTTHSERVSTRCSLNVACRISRKSLDCVAFGICTHHGAVALSAAFTLWELMGLLPWAPGRTHRALRLRSMWKMRS